MPALSEPSLHRVVRPLQPATVAALAAGVGGVLSWVSTMVLGDAVGSMVRDSVLAWTETGWAAALWLMVGAACAWGTRRNPVAAAFWGAWSAMIVALLALAAGSLALAGVAAALPFLLVVRPAPAALRLVGGAYAAFILMVGAAVATERLGDYGTVAGLGWALLTLLYFLLWASRDRQQRTRGAALALGALWGSLCFAVAVSDAVRFHDAQAWVALGATALALAVAGTFAAVHVAALRSSRRTEAA